MCAAHATASKVGTLDPHPCNFTIPIVKAMKRKTLWAVTLTTLTIIAGAVYFALPYLIRTGAGEPPLNFVAVSERLASSGQPSAAQLRELGAQGYGLVINLAPPESFGSLAEEARLVAAQGIAYVNIPVNWEQPTARDFAFFSEILGRAGERKTLGHCQMNMRASTFVFLHRVIVGGVSVDDAITDVHTVWVPNATWRKFIETTLRQHNIHYDPLAFS